MDEIWKDIPGYEGNYQASSLGRIKSLARRGFDGRRVKERIIKQNGPKGRYLNVALRKNGKTKTFMVHQLVAMAFHNHKPNGHYIVVNHINSNIEDNRSCNLEVVTARENTNKRVIKKASKYVGVSKDGDRWVSNIRIGDKKIRLGSFDLEEEAHYYYLHAVMCVENNMLENIKTKKRKYTSDYKGVYWHTQSNKWRSVFVLRDGKTKHIGSFDSEYEASLAYNEYVKKIND